MPLIPARYQLFTQPVVVTDKDWQRLAIYLSSTRQCLALLDQVNEPDLQRLIVMELMDRRRWGILDRLLMRLGKIERRRLSVQVKQILRR